MTTQLPTRPIVFISYSHDSDEQRRRVLELSERLRLDGLVVWIDQYVEDKGVEWPEWTEQQIATADLVLVVCTAQYRDAFEDKVAPGLNKGAKWEARFVRRHIYVSDSVNVRFVPVLLEGALPTDIPAALQGATYYSPNDQAGYIKLYRRISGQPRVVERQPGNPLDLSPEPVELPPLAIEAPPLAQIRILIADDHTIIRSGLRLLLEQQPDFKVVGEANDGCEAVMLASKYRPEVAVLDVGMPKLNGIEATRQIVSTDPSAQVVVLSMHSDEDYVLRALKAGARAYILKNSAEADLIRAIRSVTEGKSFFSPVISKLLLDGYLRAVEEKSVEDSYELLTSREREILQLLAEGKTNKEVAHILHASVDTVDTHRANILQKLNLHGVPELILYAVRKGIIS